MARTAISHQVTPTDSVWKKAQKIAKKLGISVTRLFSNLIEAEYEKHFN